jgi:hypothetical protein
MNVGVFANNAAPRPGMLLTGRFQRSCWRNRQVLQQHKELGSSLLASPRTNQATEPNVSRLDWVKPTAHHGWQFERRWPSSMNEKAVAERKRQGRFISTVKKCPPVWTDRSRSTPSVSSRL